MAPITDPVEDATAEWQGVAPTYVWVELAGVGLTAVLLVGSSSLVAAFAPAPLLWLLPAALLVVLAVFAAFTPRRVRSIGYRLRADDLVFRRGIMWQRRVAVPYGRMQLVDVTRGPVARALGLAELRFVTAAAATGVVIPGLPAARAEALRDELVALAESRRAGL